MLASRGRLVLQPGGPLARGEPLEIVLDGRAVRGYDGESVAAVLIADAGLVTRRTSTGASRGVYCGMGVCFECLVIVDGVPNTRSCVTLARDGMCVERQQMK